MDLSYRMASACKIERQNVISAYNVYTNNSLDIMGTPGRNVLPRNVMKTNMGPF